MTNLLMVVIAIGEGYREQYHRLFESSHQHYCERHGFGLHVVDKYIDPDGASAPVVLQRLLMCSLPQAAGYSHVAYIDGDILINRAAPSLLDAVGRTDAVALVDEFTQPTPELRLRIQKRHGFEVRAADYYRLGGFLVETKSVLNTGVIVAQPAKHRHLFESLYEQGKREMPGHPRGMHYEGALIGSALLTRSMVEVLDNRWNALFPVYLGGLKLVPWRRLMLKFPPFRRRAFRRFYADNYFIHMASGFYRGLESEIAVSGRDHVTATPQKLSL